MLFQISRIWAFRVLINRRVLIGCRFWNRTKCWRIDDEQTIAKKTDWIDWISDQLTRIFQFFMSFALVSLLWCNKFIFVDSIDCENVKNRTKQRMRFWCHWNKLTSRCSELIECRWSKQTLRQTKRNEASQTKIFVWCFEIVCWFDDLMWDCCCVWFLFFFLSSDVSTLKKMSIVEIRSCRLTKRRSTVDCLTDSKNKKIDY